MLINFINLISSSIPKDTFLKNWSYKGNVRIKEYQFKYIENNKCVLFEPITKKFHYISESDFQFLYKHWSDYCSGKVCRSELVHEPYNNSATTYTICVMKYLYDNKFIQE